MNIRKGTVALLLAALVGLLLAMFPILSSLGAFGSRSALSSAVDPVPAEVEISAKEADLAPIAGASESITGRTEISGPRLLVRTVDDEGSPVEGARLFAVSERGAALLGETGADGRTAVAADQCDPRADLMAKADGMQATVRAMPPVTDSEVLLRMERDATISGQVVFPDGSSAGEDLIVIGVRTTDLYAPGGIAEPKALQRLRLLSARTSSDGRFALSGLMEGGVYHLQAAGRGAATPGPAAHARVRAGDTDVELIVKPVFGAVVQFVGAEGGSIAETYRYPLGKWRQTNKLHTDFADSIALRLLGVPTAMHAGCEQCVAFLFSSETAVDIDRTVSYSGSIPGYEPFSTTFEVAPPVEGVFPIYPVTLTPNVEGWGALDVSFLGEDSLPVQEPPVAARLNLRSLDGQVHTYFVRSTRSGTAARIEPVPAGSFTASCEGVFRSFSWEAPEGSLVRVRPGEIAPLGIAIPQLGCIEIHVVGRNGDPIEGTAIIKLADGALLTAGGRGSWWEKVVCQSTPHVAGPLKPGRYMMELLEPLQSDEAARVIEVAPGRTTQEWFVVW